MPHDAICARFSDDVKLEGGLIDVLYPGTQIVVAIVAWLTSGFNVPGVHRESGSGAPRFPPMTQPDGTSERYATPTPRPLACGWVTAGIT
jgi:hypothetical protein